MCGQRDQRPGGLSETISTLSRRNKAVFSISNSLDLFPATQGPELSVTGCYLSQGEASLAPDSLAPYSLFCQEQGPKTRPLCDSSFHHLASVCVCAVQRRERSWGRGAGRALGLILGDTANPAEWAACHSGSACELAPGHRELKPFRGKRPEAVFVLGAGGTVPVGKGPTGAGHVCTPHHVCHMTRRGACTRQPSQAAWAPTVVRPVREVGDSWGSQPCPRTAHRPPRGPPPPPQP